MIRNSLAGFLFILVFASITRAQESSAEFKIVGYYPLTEAMKADVEKVRFDQVTHMDLAFVNPDSSGDFPQDFDALEPFIREAHKNNVKVLYSIGGGAYQGPYHELLKEKNRATLIENLVAKVLEHNVDGVDVDLEAGFAFGAETDPNYGPFVIELAEALREHNKLITTALPTAPGDVVTHEVLSQYDFINIMVYDQTGPWNPKRRGSHSTYGHALDALDYYHRELNIPENKLILGIPFYGHGFGPDLTSPVIGWMTYKEMVSSYAGAEWVDHWHLPNGYIMYYNGIRTVKNKTKLAKKRAGGVMVWQLLYDKRGPKSLLRAINEAAY